MNHLSPHTHARTHTHAHRQPHVIYAYKSVYVRVKPAQMHKRHVLHESVHNNWNNSVDLLWFLLYCRYLDGNRNADRLHTQLPTDVMCPVWHTCKKTPAKTLLVNVKCIHIYTISSVIKPISDWPLTRRVVNYFALLQDGHQFKIQAQTKDCCPLSVHVFSLCVLSSHRPKNCSGELGSSFTLNPPAGVNVIVNSWLPYHPGCNPAAAWLLLITLPEWEVFKVINTSHGQHVASIYTRINTFSHLVWGRSEKNFHSH